MKKIGISWSIKIDCECPYCEHYFDLISSDGDFWEHIRDIEIGQSKMEINCEWECPNCHKEFIIDNIQY